MSYEHRKAHAVLRVLDGQGRPVANAHLHLDQKSHDFLFGCGAFDAIPYRYPPLLLGPIRARGGQAGL